MYSIFGVAYRKYHFIETLNIRLRYFCCIPVFPYLPTIVRIVEFHVVVIDMGHLQFDPFRQAAQVTTESLIFLFRVINVTKIDLQLTFMRDSLQPTLPQRLKKVGNCTKLPTIRRSTPECRKVQEPPDDPTMFVSRLFIRCPSHNTRFSLSFYT